VEQISGGPEAAAAHTREIEELKGDLARISLDNAARTVKVTFKNKAKAVKWVGWLMPLGNRTLPLVDYEMIRERAKRTHELVMLDYYSFTIEVRTGEMSSRGMYELLTSSLGLQVQELEHSASPTTGLMERQWRVRVHSHGCPPGLRAKSHVVQGEVEAVLHHAAIHVNWPCRRCRAPEHPTRICTADENSIEAARAKSTCVLGPAGEATRQPKDKRGGRDAHARSLATMEALLRSEGSGAMMASSQPAATSSSPRLTAVAPVTQQSQEPQDDTSSKADTTLVESGLTKLDAHRAEAVVGELDSSTADVEEEKDAGTTRRKASSIRISAA
jgi:hypothetical protein